MLIGFNRKEREGFVGVLVAVIREPMIDGR